MRRASNPTAPAAACETPRKLVFWAMAIVALVVCGPPGAALAQQTAGRPAAPAAGQTAVAAAHDPANGAEPAKAAEHGRGVIDVVARIVNFSILAGTLFYVLRSPLRTYLRDRSRTIREDLVSAARMKEEAAAQLEEIDRKMKALPGELETLRAQGARETAAEEARIQAAASAARDRLLEQARREIDLQVKIAERDLVSHAADLAIRVASARIAKSITDEDQKRLVDRYVQHLRSS